MYITFIDLEKAYLRIYVFTKKITHDGRSEMDIKSRIAQAKQVFYKKKHLFTANTVSLNTRKTLIKKRKNSLDIL
jgi:hypothetical protein